MTDDSIRPKWDYPLTEKQVSKLNHCIKSVTHHQELTGVDSAREWIEFHTKNHSFVAPAKWYELFDFNPNHAGLIQPNYKGQQAIKILRQIKKWEDANQADRTMYERLRVKFEVTS